MIPSLSGNDARREYHRSLHTTLPTHKVTLSIMHNKVQLIDVGKGPTLTLVKALAKSPIQSEDLKTNHDEAGVWLLLLSFAFHDLKFCKKRGTSEHFEVGIGLHQDSALSPFLFIMLVDTLSQDTMGTTVCRRPCNN